MSPLDRKAGRAAVIDATSIPPGDAQARIIVSLRRQMMLKGAFPRRPKRTVVRLAIVGLIGNGELRPGDSLPPEKLLARELAVSLGTVQAALKQLQDSGAIVRRRGDGTRIASGEPLPSSIWHFRIVDPASELPLRFAEQSIAVDETGESGPWRNHLGQRVRYVRVRRRMVMTNGARVAAEMYLDADRVPGIAAIDPQELVMVNIRPYLEERFGIATTRATQTVRQVTLDRGLALVLGLEPRATYFEIQARSFDRAGGAVYFQRIFAPTKTCGLIF